MPAAASTISNVYSLLSQLKTLSPSLAAAISKMMQAPDLVADLQAAQGSARVPRGAAM